MGKDTVGVRLPKWQTGKVMAVWMMGDVSFAILPLVTIGLVYAAVEHSFGGFFLLKEWSFAAIVLFGAAIRRLIRLKVEIQLQPRSHKLEVGVQFYVLFVIVSVVILSLVILDEVRGISRASGDFIGVAQILLFVCSLLAMWQAIWYEENWRRILLSKDHAYRRTWYLRYIKHQVDNCFELSIRAREAIATVATLKADHEGEVVIADLHEMEERQLVAGIVSALAGVSDVLGDVARECSANVSHPKHSLIAEAKPQA